MEDEVSVWRSACFEAYPCGKISYWLYEYQQKASSGDLRGKVNYVT